MTRSRAAYILPAFFISFSIPLAVFLGILFFTGTASALESTFTVSASVISQDTAAPTTPAGLVATAASSNQIDLAWNASTDNTSVAGYRVYREGVIIATTTSNAYTDSGLFAVTQYSYNVDAFDTALNFSSISATTSATTLPVPTNTPSQHSPRNPSSRSFDDAKSVEIAVTVFPETDSAVLAWNTESYTRANVYWGQSTGYELGIVSGVIFQKNHIVKIENLIPDTEYFYRIELESNDGSINVFEKSFRTSKDITAQPPQSVVLVATAKDDSITLTWDSSEQVRLVRSVKFFPVDPYDGKVMYQGSRDGKFEDNTVEPGITYYYALFVIGESETYSAGSVAKVVLGTESEPVFSDVPYSSSYEALLQDVSLVDFNFMQKGEKISFSAGGLNLFSDATTEISIGAEKIPLGIKAIGITFNPVKAQGESVTFMLMYSKEKDKYIGIIPPLEAGQSYDIEINVFDSLNNKVKTIHVAAHVDAKTNSIESPNILISLWQFIKDNIVATVTILLLGFIIGFMARRL